MSKPNNPNALPSYKERANILARRFDKFVLKQEKKLGISIAADFKDFGETAEDVYVPSNKNTPDDFSEEWYTAEDSCADPSSSPDCGDGDCDFAEQPKAVSSETVNYSSGERRTVIDVPNGSSWEFVFGDALTQDSVSIEGFDANGRSLAASLCIESQSELAAFIGELKDYIPLLPV
jgi:hypothetical protein